MRRGRAQYTKRYSLMCRFDGFRWLLSALGLFGVELRKRDLLECIKHGRQAVALCLLGAMFAFSHPVKAHHTDEYKEAKRAKQAAQKAALKQEVRKSANKSAPSLASVSAVVVDFSDKKILHTKHSDLVMPIASITKVMTAIVTLDAGLPLNALLDVAPMQQKTNKNTYTRLRQKSKAKRGDLIRLALMSSENLAAALLGQTHPGGLTQFVLEMNKKAKALGMKDTQFVDSTGLSTGNVSTADDLVKLLRHAMKYPKIREYSTTRSHYTEFSKPKYTLRHANTNALVANKHWDIELSKTGYLNEAGRCLVMVTEIDGSHIGMVLLDSFGKRSPIGDAGRIRRWLKTGNGGQVAAAAARYKRDKLAQIQKGR